VITVWKKLENESWELVQSLEDESLLLGILESLRQANSGDTFRAEKREGSTSSVLAL